MAEVYHRKLSFDLVGMAQKVHSVLGPGFPEQVYHRVMVQELLKAKIPFESEKAVEVHYYGAICGEFRCDAVVNDCIVLEFKALESLTDNHTAQAPSFLKATGIHLGILINFGAKSLDWKRVVL